MSSLSLKKWKRERIPRLNDLAVQCRDCLTAIAVKKTLCDENLRGFVLLLSAHFQGFSRDLHMESAQIVASKVRPTLKVLVQTQFTTNRKLEHGNPNLDNLRADFDRFDFSLSLPKADPGNAARLAHLSEMNKWRNIAAHSGFVPAGLPPLTLIAVQNWQTSCDELAHCLDRIMYNQLKKLLRRPPWKP